MLRYDSGTPRESGVYACRIKEEGYAHWKDFFLFYDSHNWYYLASDQKYRGDVPYFLGPLQRRMEPDEPKGKHLNVIKCH